MPCNTLSHIQNSIIGMFGGGIRVGEITSNDKINFDSPIDNFTLDLQQVISDELYIKLTNNNDISTKKLATKIKKSTLPNTSLMRHTFKHNQPELQLFAQKFIKNLYPSTKYFVKPHKFICTQSPLANTKYIEEHLEKILLITMKTNCVGGDFVLNDINHTIYINSQAVNYCMFDACESFAMTPINEGGARVVIVFKIYSESYTDTNTFPQITIKESFSNYDHRPLAKHLQLLKQENVLISALDIGYFKSFCDEFCSINVLTVYGAMDTKNKVTAIYDGICNANDIKPSVMPSTFSDLISLATKKITKYTPSAHVVTNGVDIRNFQYKSWLGNTTQAIDYVAFAIINPNPLFPFSTLSKTPVKNILIYLQQYANSKMFHTHNHEYISKCKLNRVSFCEVYSSQQMDVKQVYTRLLSDGCVDPSSVIDVMHSIDGYSLQSIRCAKLDSDIEQYFPLNEPNCDIIYTYLLVNPMF